MGGIDDGVEPEAGGGVARVGLVVVGGFDGVEEFFFRLFVDLFAFALELLQFDFGVGVVCGFAAHDREFCRWPGEHETRVVGFAAHGVISGAEAAAENDRNFGDHAVGDRVDHLGAGADDAAPLGVFADHEAVDVVQKNERDAVLVAVHDEAGGFFGGLGVDHAAEFDAFLVGVWGVGGDVFFLIGDDAHGPAAHAGIAAQQGFSIFGAIFLEFAAVHQACDDFAHVVLLGGIAGKDSVELVDGVERLFEARVAEDWGIWRAHFVYQGANSFQARFIVGFAEIHSAADLGMHFGAAEILGGSFLADGSLHQRGPGEEEAGAFGHQNVVAHHGEIRAAGNAHAHDGGDLRNAHGAHDRVVTKDAAEVVGVREDVFLQREKYARGIDEIDGGDAIFDGDVLRANHFFRGHREKGAGFYGGVVGDDHE